LKITEEIAEVNKLVELILTPWRKENSKGWRHYLNSGGIFLCEEVIGITLKRKNNRKKEIPTRTVAEKIVLELLNEIPTFEKTIDSIKVEEWMFKRAESLSQK
jgi:hypothetical protein